MDYSNLVERAMAPLVFFCTFHSHFDCKMAECQPSIHKAKCPLPTNQQPFRDPNSSQFPVPNTLAYRKKCGRPRCPDPNLWTAQSQSGKCAPYDPAKYSLASNHGKSHPKNANDPKPSRLRRQIFVLGILKIFAFSSNGKI